MPRRSSKLPGGSLSSLFNPDLESKRKRARAFLLLPPSVASREWRARVTFREREKEKEKERKREKERESHPPPSSPQTQNIKPPRHPRLTLDERFDLARSVGEECIQDDELRLLLEKKPNPVAYDGFEPSGRMHIAQGVMKALNVNKLTKSGVTFKFWVADWFAQLNNKMGGDLAKIKVVGDYMVSSFFLFFVLFFSEFENF